MKILSDNQLYPTNKPFFPAAAQSSQLFPNFPILTQNFLPPNEKEEMTEPQPDLAESAEASEMTNTKSNNDSNVPSHREAMNQILKKLALKKQENLKKSKEESSRQVFIPILFDRVNISLHNPSGHWKLTFAPLIAVFSEHFFYDLDPTQRSQVRIPMRMIKWRKWFTLCTTISSKKRR